MLTREHLYQSLQALAARYPRLIGDALSERQAQMLADLQAQGALTSQDCAQLLGLSKEQALRDLRALRAQGLVTTRGKGPATRYTLPDLTEVSFRME